MHYTHETICAIATPPGMGGVGIVRVSGSHSLVIAQAILGFMPTPRHAHYGSFYAVDGSILDVGISIFFPGPHSYTGEDVVEFHGHGGPFVMDLLIREILQAGATIARPGEFSERAFLNNKIDLAQAEAIADLIESSSSQAARCAIRSLQGEFSSRIAELVTAITELRIYVEAAIDFPEEEVDFLDSGNIAGRLEQIQKQVHEVLVQARQGAILREGLTIVIAGEPNAGKSSLLNLLAGQDRAIVTALPGTTRDLLKEHINIDGMPLHIIDTAGLRESDDLVEQEGIRRAWNEIRSADQVLLVEDASLRDDYKNNPLWPQLEAAVADMSSLTVIKNKIDLTHGTAGISTDPISGITCINLSAKQREGIRLLREHLKASAGFNSQAEGGFIARRRHLDALHRAAEALACARQQLQEHKAGELVAEDLRRAQHALGEITGEFTSDDLLGKIFSSFCIGK
ncbi:MAG: tRNA uridine-5-carboxymethylaminomethyl(34) synthesis GTPase MnmE [Pseudomonadales bacterium]|nr:tRNA uridine-5-carboxymethylaminomethyl(34) synthesis GTPase MnmE [Pseudomonadales bacterium]